MRYETAGAGCAGDRASEAVGCSAGFEAAPAVIECGPRRRVSMTPVLLMVLGGLFGTRAALAAGGTAVTGGSSHSCVLTSRGGVQCWGSNTYGQLGNGTTTSSRTPVDVVGLTSNVVAVTSGYLHNCALTSGGAVRCWGYNAYGQLGNGGTTDQWTPVTVSGFAGAVTALGGGGYHTCAQTSGGAVQCWGRNENGQLGNGTTVNSSTPVNVVGLTSGVMALSAGAGHTCAVTSGGAVRCWGLNDDGQLGDGTTATRVTPAAVIGLSSPAASLAVGARHTCALTSGGAVLCWGRNTYGQLGDGTTSSRGTPALVTGLSSGVSAVIAGGEHTCARTSDGAVSCWGYNGYGQLGDGTPTNRWTPVAVTGLTSGVMDVGRGYYHTCAVTSSGAVQCWGWNAAGQLGDGATENRSTPVTVIGLAGGVVTVTAGVSHTCALTGAGGVQCWGRNDHGQLGDSTTANRWTPVTVSGLASGAVAVAAGYQHTCALTSGGAVQCWGDNTFGRLGDGTETQRLTPVAVTGLASGVVALAAGTQHTCAVTGGGAVQCWGSNASGQLGDGTTDDRWTPVTVSGLASGVVAVAGGYQHTCALTSGGAVQCWGANLYGQLGDGTTTERLTPVTVSGLASGVVALASAYHHTCALTSSGVAWCWGLNDRGQLGDGTTTNRSAPVAVSGLASGVAAVATGSQHTCAVTGGGGTRCWGDNVSGQLGDGTTTGSLTPVAVSGLTSGVLAVAAGYYHNCALTAVGTAWCWGLNAYGQLGDGTILPRLTPVVVIGFSGAVAPTVTSVAPASGPSAGGTAVTITGTGFVTGATVTIGGVPATNVVVGSATSITATTGAHAAGAVNVVVTNPDGQSGTLVNGFTYVPAPTVASIAPPSGPSAGGTLITVTGAGFAAGAVVTIGGVTASNVVVVSGTLITAATGARAAGVANVVVTNLDGQSGVLPNGFTYVAAPTVTSVAPASGPSVGGTVVTVTGTGFATGATVTIGGVAATNVTVLTATSITATTGAHAAGAADVVVMSSDGQSGTLPNGFTYVAAPTVTGVAPASGPSAGGTAVAIAGTGFASGATVTMGGVAAGNVVVTGATSITATTGPRTAGVVDVVVVNPDGQSGTLVSGFSYEGFTGYFAEGATISPFDCQFALANPTGTEAAVTLRFLRRDGQVFTYALVLPAMARRTVDAKTVAGLEAAEFSTAITSNVPIVADRTMSWGPNHNAAHAETSIQQPSKTWYLAEGATHWTFDLFYTIQNPHPSVALVTVRYLRPGGQAPIDKTYTVPANSRYNIWVDQEEFPTGSGNRLLAATDVSAQIASDLPVIVERSMYMSTPAQMFRAGHNSAGVTAPALNWFLSEGATGDYFDLFVLIANPNDTVALVRGTYLLPDGSTATKDYTVPANSRFNIWVDIEEFPAGSGNRVLANTAVSTTMAALNGVPIIVERAMWWPGPTAATWSEAHNSVGSTATGTVWALAEGEQGGPSNVQTYLTIANTSAYAGQAKVTLLFDDGTAPAEATVYLPAKSRTNVYPPGDFPSSFPPGAHRRFGALVESLGSTPAQIVVERPMYWDANGVGWAAGTNAVATRIR